MIKTLLCLFVGTTVWAAPQSEKAKLPLIQGIKLEQYLAQLGPNMTLEKMDSQGKGEPDIFVLFKTEDASVRQLVLQAFDVNRDKKIDLVKHYSKGKLVRTEADLDYDGLVDAVTEFDPATGQMKKKIQADGTTNIWKYYVESELRRKELDRNSDGKADMWVYYRGGRVTRTEIDQNFDGKVVLVEGSLNPNKGKKSDIPGKDKTLTQ